MSVNPAAFVYVIRSKGGTQRMTEPERAKLLMDTEVMLIKRKAGVTKDEKLQEQYGVAAIAIRRDNTFKLSNVDELGVGICVCGRPVDGTTDEPVYCRYCGQRVSSYFGYTMDNYWLQKGDNNNE